ncbi:MAG: hypothetical protein DYG94_10775 [Leptolyngbya sp. PLA3]|nr:MAG: hypothetical protein EDM82_08240 [Cyanobacteria bacterium CYA]MCE7969214.1 hypothetical protein [Leptolyngbya sp. PL-A3]
MGLGSVEIRAALDPACPAGAVSATPRSLGPVPFPKFLKALNRTPPARPGDTYEPTCRGLGVSRAGEPAKTGLLPRLGDLNPLPPKERTEIVRQVYRLERQVTTGNMIDIAW